MITALHLPILRNAEYLQFLKDFVTIVQRNNPQTLNVEAKYTALLNRINELDSLFMRLLANENTQVLVDLDTKRDNAITGITYIAMGYSKHSEPTLQSAAQKILDNLSTYGSGIARLNYQAETATLTNIINDWENKPELTAALTTLNLTDWKNELKTVNTQFNDTYINRTQEYGNTSPETLKQKREVTNTDYYALRDRINALHTLVETLPSPYDTVINQLNALIEQYNSLINNRGNTPETTPSE